MNLLDRMLGHDRWMTEHLLSMSRGIPDAQLDQEFDIGHRTLRTTFDHMIAARELWTALMAGERRGRSAPTHASIDEMLARHARSFEAFERVVRDLVASGRLDETFLDHNGYPQTYGATILQVLYHNVHHRSEVMHILQRLGIDLQTDGLTQEWEHLTGRI
ncbi:MAG TPA: DinB family protein [Thermomicrobiales bacterium]|nr:DinB family protein [Thermomicrobiales bacterium]